MFTISILNLAASFIVFTIVASWYLTPKTSESD